MTEHADYDYQELAYDLFHEGSDLLEKLVELRKERGMTQTDLAGKMNVSQGYISKIENGYTDMVSLLTDYALEIGARLHYKVEPAEKHPEGDRAYARFSTSGEAPVGTAWSNDAFTVGNADKEVEYIVRREKANLQIASIEELDQATESSVPSYEASEESSMKEMAYATH